MKNIRIFVNFNSCPAGSFSLLLSNYVRLSQPSGKIYPFGCIEICYTLLRHSYRNSFCLLFLSVQVFILFRQIKKPYTGFFLFIRYPSRLLNRRLNRPLFEDLRHLRRFAEYLYRRIECRRVVGCLYPSAPLPFL